MRMTMVMMVRDRRDYDRMNKLLSKCLPPAFHFNVYTQTDFSEDWDNSFDEEEMSEEIASESSDGFF